MEFVDTLSEWTGKFFAWLIIVLAGGLVYEVVARYIFSAPTFWAYDMSYMLCGTLFMMGVSYTLHHHAHVRIDVFYAMLSPRGKSIVEICLYLLVFFPLIVVFLVKGLEYTWFAWEIKEAAYRSAWRPPIYPFKAVLPIAAFLLLLQGVADFVRHLVFVVRGKQLGT